MGPLFDPVAAVTDKRPTQRAGESEAAVIGGTAVMPSRLVPMLTLACVLGSILYRIALALALSTGAIGLTASDVNVVTAVLVAIALWLPVRKSAFAKRAGGLK